MPVALFHLSFDFAWTQESNQILCFFLATMTLTCIFASDIEMMHATHAVHFKHGKHVTSTHELHMFEKSLIDYKKMIFCELKQGIRQRVLQRSMT